MLNLNIGKLALSVTCKSEKDIEFLKNQSSRLNIKELIFPANFELEKNSEARLKAELDNLNVTCI